jgi:hypothetical protein
MRELKREGMIDTSELLLFDILQELKKLNIKMENMKFSGSIERKGEKNVDATCKR